MLRLVGRRLRRHVLFVTAFLLKIDGRREVGQLNDINVKTAGRPFRQYLVVECSCLRSDVARVYLREVLMKPFHDASGAWLILVTIKHELAFLFGLGHIGIRHEIEHLGRGLRLSLRQHAWRRKSNEWCRADRAANFQQRASGHVSIFNAGHFSLPLVRFFFVSPRLFSLSCDNEIVVSESVQLCLKHQR